MTHRINRKPLNRNRQKGALTMISAVLILILLTELIFYAVQVGVFEQRKSSNELDQKQAFHTADSAIQVAKQFFAANATLVSSNLIDQRSDGTDGWLSADDLRWQECDGITDETHPCFGEPVDEFRAGSFFYSVDDDNTLPLDPDAYSASGNERVTLHALLCMLDIDRNADPIVQGCTTDPARWDRRYFLITLLARGEADCDGGDCQAEALIAEKIGSFGPGASDGGPGAPLTARTNVPLSGTVEIVPNPNGGGVGVPISSWVNANSEDSPYPYNTCALEGDAISPVSGSYATCEAHEFYEVDIRPDDYKCPANGQNCSCAPNSERVLTYAQGNDRQMGQDIVIDDEFPCDLWQEFFGLTWQEVKDLVPQDHLLTDCSTLDENSEGLYWVSGNDCLINDQVGGPTNAVFLISAARTTRFSAQAEFFGALMVTDKEDPDAEFTGNGGGTVYGAAIMDAEMKNFNGTFQIVWVDVLVGLAFDTPLFGAVAGGWTDFHARWQ
jgi:hypothetical protein